MYSKLDSNFKSVKEYLIIRPIIINIFCHYLSKIEEGVLLGYEMTTRKQMFFIIIGVRVSLADFGNDILQQILFELVYARKDHCDWS